MGYVCPVCEDPQADGNHLANHLAFTAMLGDDAHEAWLDDHVSDWADTSPEELAPRVTDYAEETEFPQVFEDTTGGDAHAHAHDHRHGSGHDHGDAGPLADVDGGGSGGAADPADELAGDDVDPESVLAEARELTRRRRANASADAPDEADGSDEPDEADEEAGVHDADDADDADHVTGDDA